MKKLTTGVFRFRTQKERDKATQMLRASKEIKPGEQASKTVTIETTMRAYTIKATGHRVVAIKPKGRDELHMPAKDLATVLRELDYVVRDKQEPLY